MSLWKFGKFEKEVDFTDADFLDKLDEAKKAMQEQIARVPKTGKNGDIIRAQVKCFKDFFDTLFGENASDKMFEGRTSLELCVQAAHSISEFEKTENRRIDEAYSKYYVQGHGNRQQRRAQNKGKNNYPKR